MSTHPAEVTDFVSRAGLVKGNMRFDKFFFSSVSAGAILAFACGTVLSTNADPGSQTMPPACSAQSARLGLPLRIVLDHTHWRWCLHRILHGLSLTTFSCLSLAGEVHHRRGSPAPFPVVAHAPALVHPILG
ncbi:hypothetical protein BDW68DRAFT_180948 [Aspergillus falconensis]